jgi:hypothetical protein
VSNSSPNDPPPLDFARASRPARIGRPLPPAGLFRSASFADWFDALGFGAADRQAVDASSPRPSSVVLPSADMS